MTRTQLESIWVSCKTIECHAEYLKHYSGPRARKILDEIQNIKKEIQNEIGQME